MRTYRILAPALAIALAGAIPPAQAAGPLDEAPDWPCVARKVPSLTPAAVWTGPAIEGKTLDWRADGEVAALVGRLAQRRFPLAEAQSDIEAFAESAGAAREARLTLLFAGLFDVMDAERGQIIEGIGRYARRQRELAATVREMSTRLDALRATPGADANEIVNSEVALIWETRVYNERRSVMTFICDVPRDVEQRLFALGRSISAAVRD